MPRHRREVASKVAEHLFATETAIDAALAQAAAFVGFMPAARQDAQLSAVVGQPALDHAISAIAALNEARRQMVSAHHALAEVQGQIGLGAVNFGGLIDKPDYPKQARLGLVRTAAA
jgi:hypothetical protein